MVRIVGGGCVKAGKAVTGLEGRDTMLIVLLSGGGGGVSKLRENLLILILDCSLIIDFILSSSTRKRFCRVS